MRQGAERLLEIPGGLPVRRPRHGFLPRLPTVRQSLVPHLAPQSMVPETLDILGHPVPGEYLQDLDDTGMQPAPPLLQETAISHLVCEGVREGVGAFGEQTCLIEKLRRLEV